MTIRYFDVIIYMIVIYIERGFNVMARSMTGYGRASEVLSGKEILIEIKSVNSKFLDCNIKLPRLYGYLEDKIKSHIQSKGVIRGKIDILVCINEIENSDTQIHVDMAYAKSYIDACRELQATFALTDDITVMNVAKNPQVFTSVHKEEDAEAVWQDVLSVLNSALEGFLAGRLAEGERLKDDLLAKKVQLERLTDHLEARASVYTDTYRTKLESRLKEVLEKYNVEVDSARILTECAIFADKTAIDEELVRLRSHFVSFEEIFKLDEPIGRKLDFLLQEFNREVNTSGSKCSDAESAAIVVDMKCLIEKIREQVQNLE